MKSVVGVIPARAGSKRLPNKNLALLDGRPLIVHTCTAARDSGALSAVYVNTDSPEIAAVAAQSGARCPVLRPKHLADDDTPTRESNLFLLNYLARRGERCDAVMVLQPTSPLRTWEDIRVAWRLFQEHAPCEVASVSPVVPRGWLGTLGPGRQFERWSGEDGDELVYRLNGAIYVHVWDDYVTGRPAEKTIAYAMPAWRGVDIDTREDLEYARFLTQQRQQAALV